MQVTSSTSEFWMPSGTKEVVAVNHIREGILFFNPGTVCDRVTPVPTDRDPGGRGDTITVMIIAIDEG